MKNLFMKPVLTGSKMQFLIVFFLIPVLANAQINIHDEGGNLLTDLTSYKQNIILISNAVMGIILIGMGLFSAFKYAFSDKQEAGKELWGHFKKVVGIAAILDFTVTGAVLLTSI